MRTYSVYVELSVLKTNSNSREFGPRTEALSQHRDRGGNVTTVLFWILTSPVTMPIITKSHQCHHTISPEYYDLQRYRQQNSDVMPNVLNKQGPFSVKSFCKSSFTRLTTANVNTYPEHKKRDVTFRIIMFLC